jgi:hemerythrin
MRLFLEWREDWLLGCEVLDEQHLELAERMNQLYLFLTDLRKNLMKEPDGLKRRLTELFEETRRHFLDEEALMEAYNYPGLAAHHREHVMLLAEMQECLREIKTNNRLFTLENLKSLKFWQIDHVLNSDREFAEFLNTLAVPLHERPSLSAIA